MLLVSKTTCLPALFLGLMGPRNSLWPLPTLRQLGCPFNWGTLWFSSQERQFVFPPGSREPKTQLGNIKSKPLLLPITATALWYLRAKAGWHHKIGSFKSASLKAQGTVTKAAFPSLLGCSYLWVCWLQFLWGYKRGEHAESKQTSKRPTPQKSPKAVCKQQNMTQRFSSF